MVNYIAWVVVLFEVLVVAARTFVYKEVIR